MSHAVELRFDGGVDLRVIVPMDVCPDGGVAIKIFISMLIMKVASIPLHQHERIMLRCAPLAHGREGMPQMGFVEFDES